MRPSQTRGYRTCVQGCGAQLRERGRERRRREGGKRREKVGPGEFWKDLKGAGLASAPSYKVGGEKMEK